MPDRAWHGKEFADIVIQQYMTENPSVPLKLDSASLFAESDTKPHDARLSAYDIVGVARFALPRDILVLAGKLHAGNPIPVDSKRLQMPQKDIEAKLIEWVLAHREGTVAPHELFVQALKGANGDILVANILVWNILCRNWNYAATRNYSLFRARFVDVTGEEELRDAAGQFIVVPEEQAFYGWMKKGRTYVQGKKMTTRIRWVTTKRGDVFSALYHFFGVMLLSNYASGKYGSPWVGRLFGTAGALKEAFLHTQTAGPAGERQKRIWNDLQGSHASFHFLRLAADPEVRVEAGGTPEEMMNRYLKPNSRFDERSGYQLEADGRPPAYYRINTDKKFWFGPMGEDEISMRLEYALWRDSTILHPTILAISRDGERLQAGLDLYAKSGAKNDALNSLIAQWIAGYRGDARADLDYDFTLGFRDRLNIVSRFKSYELDGIFEKVYAAMYRILEMKGIERPSFSVVDARNSFPQRSRSRACEALFAP